MPLMTSTYDYLHRRAGLSRKEVQEAIDDLIAQGRITIAIEGRRIVVQGVE
jgi:hypothetical protein